MFISPLKEISVQRGHIFSPTHGAKRTHLARNAQAHTLHEMANMINLADAHGVSRTDILHFFKDGKADKVRDIEEHVSDGSTHPAQLIAGFTLQARMPRVHT